MTLDDLRKIAEAATPGPWEAVTDGKPDFYGLPEWRIGNPAYPPVTRAGMTRESAEFIATFNPKRVLELLDENQRLQALIEPCHCDKNPGTTDGPEEDCPQHGRPYAYWVDAVSTLAARLAAVEEVHTPVEIEPSDTICGHCSFQLPNGKYFGKVVEWPCDDIKAVRGD